MVVPLTGDIQAKVDRLAAARGGDAEGIVREAIERLADYDEWFVREVEKGLASGANGAILSHEEMGARLERLIAAKQRHS